MFSWSSRTFGLQKSAQECCVLAGQESPPHPMAAPLLVRLVLARITSLVAFGVAVVGVVPNMGSRVFEVAHIVRCGGLRPEPVLRAGLSVVLGVTATAGRVATAALGVLSPEITYNLLKLHTAVLFLDLLQRTEVLAPEEAVCQARGVVSGQRWRVKTAWSTTCAVSQASGPLGRACLITGVGRAPTFIGLAS